ncbi:MAG: PAS domain S-box protein [Euryarchaeota archaeon]|jgi:PAS domain S-box-containing protein|uniref:PAS domain S-box protein n=1 Tax=Methanobacterium sp. MZD130B TaxID=3394378 RepID=UPI00175F142A|nr:PAS domain S-box protein [Euryarchaeota archaeon]HHT18406.1 PAS domain S-box protein [Methanobacterium sp.]
MDETIKILILEDVPLDVELMEAELKRDGIDFISCRVETEEEYREALNNFGPDVILADHSLPHFDGISAMNITQDISSQTPFIFVSGQMGEEFAVEMLKEGATDYVLKHNLSKLGHSVRRALSEAEEFREKKKAQEKLAKSEEKYKTLFDLSPDYVVVVDPDGVVLDINQRLNEDISISKEECIGKDINEIFKSFADDSIFKEDFLDKLLTRDQDKPMEIKVLQDREVIYLEMHHAPIMKQGKIFAIQIIFRNITQRKNAEKALIESRERLSDVNAYLETIINASPFAIVDLYPDGRVKSLWNPAAENIFGWKSEEVLGKHLPFLNGKNSEEFQYIIQRSLSNESKSDVELECARKNGEMIHTMMATAPLMNADGNIQGVLATFVDISDMIAAENQIMASLEEKEVLLREIHHRVKNNLQIISSLMNLQSEYTHEPEILKMFQESKNRIRSMALIHEKLYQSKDLAHIDFVEYLKSLVDMLLGFYREKSNNIDVSLKCGEINLEIDTAISMGLIVNELLSNCFKHAFPGQNRGEVSITLFRSGKNYLLEVADNGVGIPDDVDIKKTDSLGLLIVHTLTLQLKGTLEHFNDEGTKFRLSFPDKRRG